MSLKTGDAQRFNLTGDLPSDLVFGLVLSRSADGPPCPDRDRREHLGSQEEPHGHRGGR